MQCAILDSDPFGGFRTGPGLTLKDHT
jgi:hypothetical protein